MTSSKIVLIYSKTLRQKLPIKHNNRILIASRGEKETTIKERKERDTMSLPHYFKSWWMPQLAPKHRMNLPWISYLKQTRDKLKHTQTAFNIQLCWRNVLSTLVVLPQTQNIPYSIKIIKILDWKALTFQHHCIFVFPLLIDHYQLVLMQESQQRPRDSTIMTTDYLAVAQKLPVEVFIEGG